MTEDQRDRVALMLAAVVGTFVLSTLTVVFILALNGTGLPDVWTSLFGLVVAIMSALGGYLAGSARRTGRPDPAP